MKFVCVQVDSAWENKAISHKKVMSLLEAAQPEPGCHCVLPEMFATGFSMNPAATSDSQNNETYRFLIETARKFKVYLTAGIVSADPSGKGRNESLTLDPSGKELARYCKLHPFTPAGELDNYVRGKDVVTYEAGGFTIAPMICYDLRFPEIFRRATLKGANLFTVIASWPATRHHHWEKLLQARAIENQAFVIGVNRCGKDPQFFHAGGSRIIDPQGNILIEAGEQECVISAEAYPEAVKSFREKLPFLSDIRSEFLAFPPGEKVA